MPIKLKGPILFCDVDDTLVSWNHYGSYKEGMIEFTAPNSKHPMWLEPIYEHIEAIKSHKLRKHSVVVWSYGGEDWAEEVVNKLGLNEYVDLIVSKPDFVYDDHAASDIIPEECRIHLRLKRNNNAQKKE